jgi:predicted nucleic acid-binding protein
MKKVLIDTNIVIDLLAKRERFYDAAAELFSLSDKRELKLFISALTFANTSYVLSKQLSARNAKEVLRKFKTLVEVLSLDDKVIELALSDDDFGDFEDGLQYYSALENGVEMIITRNKKDFKNSEMPVFTAQEYLAMI